MMCCTRHGWRLYFKRKKSQVTEATWSFVLSPSVLFTSCKISIYMLERNDEEWDTTAQCIRQKMLWSQINSSEFKFNPASFKPFELLDLFCTLNNGVCTCITAHTSSLEGNTKLLPKQKLVITYQFSNTFFIGIESFKKI